jgi:hypothetical protein
MESGKSDQGRSKFSSSPTVIGPTKSSESFFLSGGPAKPCFPYAKGVSTWNDFGSY